MEEAFVIDMTIVHEKALVTEKTLVVVKIHTI
jgi:hypothetical protein